MLLGWEVTVGGGAGNERLVGDVRDGRRPALLEQLGPPERVPRESAASDSRARVDPSRLS